MTVASNIRFPREIGLKRKRCDNQKQFTEYVRRLLGKSSVYTSLYSFGENDSNKPWRFDYTTARIDKAWWDFDAGERGGIECVKQDVVELINRLRGDVYVVATGRGFHVYQFFKRVVTGYEWRNHLNRYQREMSKGLKTLDGVGLPEKLVRIPNTYNPKRGRWSVCIDAKAFRDNPDAFIIPKKPNTLSFSLCPFLNPIDRTESFDLVQWVHDNPEPKKAAETHRNGHFVISVDDSVGMGDIPIPPCISSAVERENPNHYSRIALVQHLSEELRFFADPDSISSNEWETIEETIFEHIKTLNWRDFNPSKTRLGIRSNMKYKQSPTCRAMKSRGMCGGLCWRYDGTF